MKSIKTKLQIINTTMFKRKYRIKRKITKIRI